MAYVFISHDLSTVRALCSRIIVMYLGRIVEEGSVEAVFANPYHPYTRALLSAIPIPDPKVKREVTRLKGETPSLVSLPKGCALQERCPEARSECRREEPPWRSVGGNHFVACHLIQIDQSPSE